MSVDPPDSRTVRPGHMVSYAMSPGPVRLVEHDTDPIVLLNRMVCLSIRVELWSPQPDVHVCHLVGIGRYEAGSLVGVIRKAWDVVRESVKVTL